MAGTKSKYYKHLANWYQATGGDPDLPADGETDQDVGVDDEPLMLHSGSCARP